MQEGKKVNSEGMSRGHSREKLTVSQNGKDKNITLNIYIDLDKFK